MFIRGTAVFYDDTRIPTTKLFGADTVPSWKLSEDVINLAR